VGKATATVTISNRLGLHARPAMMFAECANQFGASITVRRADQQETLDGKSLMKLMMLAATQGTKIELCADGEDAEKALAELRKLIESKFGED
jgi:phosphocarrier protein